MTDPPQVPVKPSRQRRATPRVGTKGKVVPLALLSFTCFLAALLLLWVLVAKAELLTQLGLEGKLYYLVLLPLGLAISGSLFGFLRSYAYYRGKVLGGALELGGPVVVFCLIVIGGFWLVPSSESFSVSVFVHGEGGIHELPLRREGAVVLDLDADRRREAIGEKGEAYFAGIPARFRGQEVPVWLDAEDFESASPNTTHRLVPGNIYLVVRRKAAALRGRVQDTEGRPIAGASLHLRELTTTSGPDGFFLFQIPGSLLEEDLSLDVSIAGYQPWREQIVPRSNDIAVVLRRPTQ